LAGFDDFVRLATVRICPRSSNEQKFDVFIEIVSAFSWLPAHVIRIFGVKVLEFESCDAFV
jgi:hypothetical protein